MRRELGKLEPEKEEICKVERRRVGEPFSLVNNGLRHISHMIFSPCLYPTFLFLRTTSASCSTSLARFLLSPLDDPFVQELELPLRNSEEDLDSVHVHACIYTIHICI